MQKHTPQADEPQAEPRVLSERESYEQMLRALRRLRSKRLAWGSMWDDGQVCAVGAAHAHAATATELESIPENLASWSTGSSRFFYAMGTRGEATRVNDNFRPHKDDPSNQRARYRHVLRWLEAKVRGA